MPVPAQIASTAQGREIGGLALSCVQIENPMAILRAAHWRNALTKAMKDWGYGEGYRYPHDEGGHAQGVSYLPEKLASRRYYEPKNAGFEIKLAARLARLRGQTSDQVASNESESPSGAIEKEP